MAQYDIDMKKEDVAELIKEKIFDVESSKRDENKRNEIVTVHLNADIFLKLAYLYVGVNGK